MKRVVAERRKALTKAIEGLGQHGLVGTSDESLLSLHEALKVQFEVVQKVVYMCSSLLQLTLEFRIVILIEKSCHLCLVRDIKNRILQFSNSPILEFKVLQNVFKIKKQGLKCF